MYYQVVSFSHHNCDQGIREKLAFSNDEEKIEILNLLVAFEFVHEASQPLQMTKRRVLF